MSSTTSTIAKAAVASSTSSLVGKTSGLTIRARPSQQRGKADHGWLKTFHTFSFAQYHDPRYESFGPLRVINEDRVAPGEGFGTHSHSEFGIFSYIVNGELEHRDSMGNVEIMRRGDLQMTEAGESRSFPVLPAYSADVRALFRHWNPPLGVQPQRVPPGALPPDLGSPERLSPQADILHPPRHRRAEEEWTRPYRRTFRDRGHRRFKGGRWSRSRAQPIPAFLASLLTLHSVCSDPCRSASVRHPPRSSGVCLAHLPARAQGHRASQGLRPRRARPFSSYPP